MTSPQTAAPDHPSAAALASVSLSGSSCSEPLSTPAARPHLGQPRFPCPSSLLPCIPVSQFLLPSSGGDQGGQGEVTLVGCTVQRRCPKIHCITGGFPALEMKNRSTSTPAFHIHCGINILQRLATIYCKKIVFLPMRKKT